jgi:hypothetical protein
VVALKRAVGAIVPVVIVAGLVVTLGALKHSDTLSPIEEQKIERNLQVAEQAAQQKVQEAKQTVQNQQPVQTQPDSK